MNLHGTTIHTSILDPNDKSKTLELHWAFQSAPNVKFRPFPCDKNLQQAQHVCGTKCIREVYPSHFIIRSNELFPCKEEVRFLQRQLNKSAEILIVYEKWTRCTTKPPPSPESHVLWWEVKTEPGSHRFFIQYNIETIYIAELTPSNLLEIFTPELYVQLFPTPYYLALERIFQNDDMKYIVREFLGINTIL